MTEVGAVERVTLNVSPYDNTTAVALTLYDPRGNSTALTEPVSQVGASKDAWDAVVTYDEAGQWLLVWEVTGTGASGPVYQRVVVTADPRPPFVIWPPSLEEVKDEMKLEPGDRRDDRRIARELAAAVAFVERVHASRYDFHDESGSGRPSPTADLALGTMRLAIRWVARGRSQDGLIDMGELGSTRVPSFDPDIDRLLQIGRFAPPVFA